MHKYQQFEIKHQAVTNYRYNQRKFLKMVKKRLTNMQKNDHTAEGYEELVKTGYIKKHNKIAPYVY